MHRAWYWVQCSAVAFCLIAPHLGAQGQAPADSGVVGDSAAGEQGSLRHALEQEIRRKFAQVVRNRLGLTDAQMLQLRRTNQKFSQQRRVLTQREQGFRKGLQQELRPGVAADQQHVAALMDSLIVVQRDRLDLLVEEQRDLSTFLTPVQRVQYYSLQEQLRKRLQEVQQQAAAHPLLYNTPGGGALAHRRATAQAADSQPH